MLKPHYSDMSGILPVTPNNSLAAVSLHSMDFNFFGVRTLNFYAHI